MWSCDKVDMKKVIYVQILYHLQPSYQPNGEWPTPPPRTNLMIFVSNPANGDVCRTQTTGVGNRESPGSTSILEKIWKYEISHTIFINIQFLDWRSAWNLRTSWVESNIHGLISWSWLFQFMLSFNISTYTYLEMAIQGHPTPCWRCHHDALFTSKGGFYWFPAIFTE